ncbi:transposase [Jannaschia pagri]|uniref:transposase n=1 Tax=Jannaschia TaxID=188905 RepID=UPI001C7D5E7E
MVWLSGRRWSAIVPHLPTNQPGTRRAADRRAIPGIVHVPRFGCPWRDCPAVYGRWSRCSRRSIWKHLFAAPREIALGAAHVIDSAFVKVARSATGSKGEARHAIARAGTHDEGPPDRGHRTIERAMNRLRDWRRVRTRYDQGADTCRSVVHLADAIT